LFSTGDFHAQDNFVCVARSQVAAIINEFMDRGYPGLFFRVDPRIFQLPVWLLSWDFSFPSIMFKKKRCFFKRAETPANPGCSESSFSTD